MKKLLLSTAVLTAFATTAMAETTTTAETTATVDAATSAEMTAAASPFRKADPLIIPASDFIGMRVYASEVAMDADEVAGLQDGWEDIGEINEVLLRRDGAVDSVLVDIGGFLGIGERQVAVGMESIRFVADSGTAEDLDDFFLVMTGNRAVFEGAPAYETRTEDNAAVIDPNTAAPQATAEATTAQPAAEMTEPMPEITAEALTGAPVYDTSDAWIGEVSQLILTPEGEVSQAIVDVGGFLGLGAKPVALNLEQLDIQREEGSDDLRLRVALTKAELEAMPEHAG